MDSPFFQGTIGDAIALSLQLRSVLGCFITDSGTESARWESIFRENSALCARLKSDSVFIRLEQGSVEAGYLAAYCPIDAVPIVIFIKNGAVVGVVRQEQSDALVKALEAILTSHGRPITAHPSLASSVGAGAVPLEQPSAPAPQQSSLHQPQPQSQTPAQSPLSAPTSRDKGKQKAQDGEPSNAPQTPDNAQSRRKNPKKKDDAERQRIMQLLENDKKERQRRKQEEKERLAKLHTPPEAPSTDSRMKNVTNTTSETHISFRLLSGKSIKHTFQSSATLSNDVRPWLDAHQDPEEDHTDIPYTFLHILTPLPNHPIGISEEELPLRELLPQRCSLVLVAQRNPVANAYSRSNPGLIGSLYNTVGGLLSWVWGGSSNTPSRTYNALPTQDVDDPDNYNENDSLLRDDEPRDGPEGNTYYNGNQTSFQRPDDSQYDP